MLLDASAAMVTTEPFKVDEEREGGKRSTGTGMLAGIVDWLRGYAAQAWYPWVVGLLSGVNNFTVVFSAPLVVLFLSGKQAASAQNVSANRDEIRQQRSCPSLHVREWGGVSLSWGCGTVRQRSPPLPSRAPVALAAAVGPCSR